ncbi:MAG: DUF5678 domain-containing protein [Anaerolineae bacterium]
MLTVTLKADIADQIEELAEAADANAEEIVDKALRSYLALYRRNKIRVETEAFEQQKDRLLDQYAGEYVAIHNGEVIDHDGDLRTLHLRVFARLGHTPVLLKQVARGAQTTLVFRSPRFERGQQ